MVDYQTIHPTGQRKRLVRMPDDSYVEVVAAILMGGSSDNLAEVDGAASALVTQGMIHKMVHLGLFYEANYFAEGIADDGTLEIMAQTAAAQSTHLRFIVSAGGDAKFQVFEGTSVSGNGTPITPINRNRISSNIAVTSFHRSPTINSAGDGTDLTNGGYFIPGGSGFFATGGGSASSFQEFILKPSETYLFRLTNIAGTAQPLGMIMEFYEPS